MLQIKSVGNSRVFLALVVAMSALALIFGWWVSRPHQVGAQTATLEYTLTGGQLIPIDSDPWIITRGCMSWQLFDVLPDDRATYEVTGFSIEVVEPSGTVHTISVVREALPLPFDNGEVNVISDGFIDMIIVGLSIDGQPEVFGQLGGPASPESFWTGTFPEPISFLVRSHAELPSLGISTSFDGFTLTGELSPCVPRGVGGVTSFHASSGSDIGGVSTLAGTAVAAFAAFAAGAWYTRRRWLDNRS